MIGLIFAGDLMDEFQVQKIPILLLLTYKYKALEYILKYPRIIYSITSFIKP